MERKEARCFGLGQLSSAQLSLSRRGEFEDFSSSLSIPSPSSDHQWMVGGWEMGGGGGRGGTGRSFAFFFGQGASWGVGGCLLRCGYSTRIPQTCSSDCGLSFSTKSRRADTFLRGRVFLLLLVTDPSPLHASSYSSYAFSCVRPADCSKCCQMLHKNRLPRQKTTLHTYNKNGIKHGFASFGAKF